MLAALHGGLVASVVPPWQAPDEAIHYQYLVALTRSTALFPDYVVLSPQAHREVTESLYRFRFWEYNNWITPESVPGLPEGETYLGRAGGVYYRLAAPVLAAVGTWPIEARLGALRLYSLVWLVLTVALTYSLAREVFLAVDGPESLYPLAAATVVALFPQYVFVASSFNDDNLVPPLSVLVLLALFRMSRAEQDRDRWRWWLVALVAGSLAVLTKRTGAVAAAMAVSGALLIAARAWRSGRETARLAGGAMFVVALAAIVAGMGLLIWPPLLPIEVSNRLRVDPQALIRLVQSAQVAFSRPWQAWYPDLLFLTLSFWGWFGWLTAPLSLGVISVVRYLSVGMTAGMMFGTVSLLTHWRDPNIRRQLLLLGLLVAALAGQLALILGQHLIDPRSYTLTGRYLFPFISAFAILVVWGWSAWWPARWKPAGAVVGLALLVALDAYAIIGVMIPYWYS
jgi:4-amino-4-deoxy-L-arabinose transferase-like glycosyltransferase